MHGERPGHAEHGRGITPPEMPTSPRRDGSEESGDDATAVPRRERRGNLTDPGAMDAPAGRDYFAAQIQEGAMNYQRFFEEAIDQLHAERRYRIFADLERIVGSFPRALWRNNGDEREITVWCSNDYLGMGQHPTVIEASQKAAGAMGSGAGGTRNISGTNHPLVEL